MTTSKEELKKEVFTIIYPYLGHFSGGDVSGLSKEIVSLINEHTKQILKEVMDELPKSHSKPAENGTSDIWIGFDMAVAQVKSQVERRMKEL